MPRPGKKESKQKFISRAISEFRKEGISAKEAIGRAYGFWRTYKGKGKGKGLPEPKKD